MPAPEFDLVIIGAGSGGLTAAGFAAKLGARVALVEKGRIGGDCTWTGCVPSKALLRAARAVHEIRQAARFGVTSSAPVVDMNAVREYVRQAIQQVYRFETPEDLRGQGIDVIPGAARFVDPNTILVGERAIQSKTFLITTGARPQLPPIVGLNGVPFVTHEQVFENDRMPDSMLVVGGGPVGTELAQAYQRFGARVTIIADRLLPKDEPEAREVIQRVFEREGVRFVHGRAISVRSEGREIVVSTTGEEARGDLLLIAAGRKPAIAGLDLELAGVQHSEDGIPVDDQLRTSVKNIYAAGDVVGGYQFTHYAGWQAFQAVRNALLPGSASGLPGVVPWVTFTDPEIAHVGLSEEQARLTLGDEIKVCLWEMSRTDRAICEDDRDGFLKVITSRNGTVLGATVVNARAGETITEFIVAIQRKMKISELSGIIHAYPTYSSAAQQLAGEMAVEGLLSGASGKVIRGLSKIIR